MLVRDDYGVCLADAVDVHGQPSVEPATLTDLAEVLDCAVDELRLAQRIANELEHRTAVRSCDNLVTTLKSLIDLVQQEARER